MTMLLDHYGLSEPPFGLTPHTEFFFSGGERGPILDALLYAIDHEDGIVQVAGEVGTGKTMLARMLLERLPPSVQAIYLANPSLGRDDMLSVLATELQVEPASERTVARIRGIEERLVELYAAGRRILLIIDEAHTMPADTLELIRLLANLETTRHKLLRILLFAQPELDALLARPDMRQLKDRITQRFMLRPLDRTEFASYLRHRLTRAGYRGPDLFSPAAVGILHRASGGLVRRTHVLAGKALLAAYAQGRHAVGRREAEAAIQDANG
ncbi:MAG TPA: AAA family ATPase, partial [Rhodocyclaceae bacterium]|nr:AAA family ATPase [Rhodocyclaceae bacterium]